MTYKSPITEIEYDDLSYIEKEIKFLTKKTLSKIELYINKKYIDEFNKYPEETLDAGTYIFACIVEMNDFKLLKLTIDKLLDLNGIDYKYNQYTMKQLALEFYLDSSIIGHINNNINMPIEMRTLKRINEGSLYEEDTDTDDDDWD